MITENGRISAIIPTWNRADLLRGILANLGSQTWPADEIVVVDNGSSDQSCELARSTPGVTLISFPDNRGFAEAVNAGIARSSGDWILILNNDLVLAENWLETLLRSAVQENADFAAGKLLDHRDSAIVDGSWDLVSRAAYAWRCGYGRQDSAVWNIPRTIAFAPMTAALFQRSVFDRIGVLEARFESYYEDVDFGVRCALANLRGIYEPNAVARHMGKSTLGKVSYRVMYLTARNQILLLAKYYSFETVNRFLWPILVGQLLAILAAARHGHLLAALLGKYEGLRRWTEFRRTSGDRPSTVADDRRRAEAVEAAFATSEREIRNLQQQIGFDPYWRLYFGLVGR